MLCRWYYVDIFRSENAIKQSSWGKQEEKLPINCEKIGLHGSGHYSNKQ